MLKSIFVNGIEKVECISHPNLSKISISQFKYLVRKKTSVPVNVQKLRFAGKLLEDNKRFQDYPHIVNGSIIDLSIGLKGGSNKPISKNNKTTKKNKMKNKNKTKNKNKNGNDIENFLNDIKENFGFPSASSIGKAVAKPFVDAGKAVMGPLNAIADFFKMIWETIKWVFYLLVWLVTDLLNPMVWINDVILGAFIGLKLFFAGILDGCFSLIRNVFNKIFQPVARGIWGNEFTDHSQSKCFKAPTCTVPYPILFATIILPPLGVFMELGLKGWLNILLCAALTLFYYLPGLIYALILLYC